MTIGEKIQLTSVVGLLEVKKGYIKIKELFFARTFVVSVKIEEENFKVKNLLLLFFILMNG